MTEPSSSSPSMQFSVVSATRAVAVLLGRALSAVAIEIAIEGSTGGGLSEPTKEYHVFFEFFRLGSTL